jgi:hypothetical protein
MDWMSPRANRLCTEHCQADDLMTVNRCIFGWNQLPARMIRSKRQLEKFLNLLKLLNVLIVGVQ